VRHLTIPADTLWFCSMDWGYNAPGVILWWADVGDGHWHVTREWKFSQTTAEDVGKGWHERNAQYGGIEPIAVVGDPAMWAKTGAGRGESVAETLARYRLPMVKGDNDRLNGWQRCHELLRLAPDGFPWVTVDVACKYGVRTVPAQQSDQTNADDLDTNGDDHWVDAFRYGAMSRFVTKRTTKTLRKPKPWSFGWIKRQDRQPSRGVMAR